MFSRIAAFLYGSVCYLVFLGSFLYAIGFLGNFAVPKPMDSAPHLPLMQALAIDAGLLALFAVQHSIMAREWFKKAWTRLVRRPLSAAPMCSSARLRCCCCIGNGSRWLEWCGK